LIFVGVALLWNTWAVYPLKVLVVFFHELSHGLAAILTGGSIVEIELSREQGGTCITQGGNRFLILSAGYLGSLLFGGTLLLLAARSRNDKAITMTLACVLLGVTLLFVRPWFGFGMVFGLATATALFLAAQFLGKVGNDWLVQIIGLTSCLYAVLDIKSDILDRPEVRSDARMLAELTGIPTIVWGVIWLVLALALTIAFVLRAARAAEAQSGDPASAA
jgi:hypothetical protein